MQPTFILRHIVRLIIYLFSLFALFNPPVMWEGPPSLSERTKEALLIESSPYFNRIASMAESNLDNFSVFCVSKREY